MLIPRIIARLDIKAPNLIKGIHLEGLRVIGDPQLFAEKYYQQGIDELIYIDSVASLYERNNIAEIVEATAAKLFVPMTVGGGIRSLHDVERLLKSGADKIAINTAAVRSPDLLNQIAKRFGSQCLVLNVEAKRIGKSWEVFTDNGREKTGLDVIEWIYQSIDRGVGEILLTSVDQEGTNKGFDLELIAQCRDMPVPVIASGGAGQLADIAAAIKQGADAVAIAHLLHYDKITVAEIKDYLSMQDIPVKK